LDSLFPLSRTHSRCNTSIGSNEKKTILPLVVTIINIFYALPEKVTDLTAKSVRHAIILFQTTAFTVIHFI
jgi:hypothetical protein